MTCRKLSRRARAEQDYWLGLSDSKVATEVERLDFLRFDSHGGPAPIDNPILLGKRRHDQYVEMVRESYFDMNGGWPGGLAIVAEAIADGTAYRDPRAPLRFWRAAFGKAAVHRWLCALLSPWLCEEGSRAG